MEITICKTAGLCAGATRSYNAAIEALKGKKKVKMYHQILHNQKLIDDLNSKGSSIIFDIKEADVNDHIVLKAHGEEKSVFEYLENKKIEYSNTICTNVKRVHDIALGKEKEGYTIILVGKKTKTGDYHPEIGALKTYLNNPVMISELSDVEEPTFSDKKYFMVSQTTFNNEKFLQIAQKTKDLLKAKNIEFDSANTICNFPLVNINESLKLASASDVAIVLGSKNSSNTTELFNAVKDVCPTIFNDDFQEIGQEVATKLEKNKVPFEKAKICILAGASTLKSDLEKLKTYLGSKDNVLSK